MYRVDVTDDNRTWANNDLTFETTKQAETYARNLAWRWTAVKGYRIVPANHPQQEPVDYEATAEAGFICHDYTL